MIPRIALVFPPPAGPTYVPLGLASLVSWVRAHVPEARLSVHDANIALWHEMASTHVSAAALLDFLRGRAESFYDSAAYTARLSDWAACSEQIAAFRKQARAYLDAGTADAEFTARLDALLAPALADMPEIVGFSVMYPDQAVLALAMARRLAQADGRRPRILLGGAALSAIHVQELLAAAPFIDGVLPGEGEVALAAICGGEAPDRIPGLVGRDQTNPAAPAPALDALAAPDFAWADLNLYANPSPVLPAVFSRDCAWNRCRFCAHNFSFDGYRRKSVVGFVDELQMLNLRHDARHFYLADQYVPAGLLAEVSEEILARELDVRFHVMARPTAEYTPERLALAAAAGCTWISWGVESGSQRLLNLVRKGTRRPAVEQVLADSRAAGIRNLPMMIFGLPTSTQADLEETFHFLDCVWPDVDAVTASSFVLFDGTPFAAEPRRFGLEVTGREILLRIGGEPVHSSRLHYAAIASDGRAIDPPGPWEVSRWMQRRRWMGEPSIWESLCCEHFLLFSAAERADDKDTPRPAPIRAA